MEELYDFNERNIPTMRFSENLPHLLIGFICMLVNLHSLHGVRENIYRLSI